MERRGKRRRGSIFTRKDGGKVTWWARITYTDPVTHKRRDLQRRAKSRAHAEEIRDRLISDLDRSDGRLLDHERCSFSHLADFYQREFVKEAEYVNDEKVRGLRGHRTVSGQVKVVRQHFGHTLLRSLTYGDLRDFRNRLLQTPTVRGGQRSVAHVNRMLSLVRRMLNVAVEEGWLDTNPFSKGRPLIVVSAERRRDRVLSREEESRLLAACADPRRAHLRPILICALDTGMRLGEILRLRWRDIGLQQRTIVVQKLNTKSLTERRVGITARLAAELEGIAVTKSAAAEGDDLVFDVTTIKRAFTTARRVAGIGDIRFHDLRHCLATRLVQGGLPIAEVARVLGHSQLSTAFRYISSDDLTVSRAVGILERMEVKGVNERDGDDESQQ